MMLNISFDFDESTHKISNLKVIEKEKLTIPEIEVIENYDLKILDNKIQLTSEAIDKLGITIGDRVSINYWYAGPNNAYPIISKSGVFDDGVEGNKLIKSKTFSFRGEQRDTLLKYGTVFSFEEWKDKTGKVKDGVFKLIPVKEDDREIEEQILTLEEADIEEITQSEIEDDANWLFEL